MPLRRKPPLPSCRDPSRSGRQRPLSPRAPRAQRACSARRTKSYVYGGRSMPRLRRAAAHRAAVSQASALPLAQRFVFVEQEIEVSALFVGKLEKDSLAFGILEAFAVPLEEVVRATLALDADQQRLEIVDAFAKLFRARGEQAAGRALEEQESRPRLEQRISGQELGVALLERAEMFAFLFGQLLKHRSAACVLCDAGGSGVELQTAAFRRDGDAQCVAGKDELRRRTIELRRRRSGRRARAALFTGAENLHDCLRRREVARGRDLFGQRLHIRAHELRRAMTSGANQVEVTRMPVGRLESRSPFAEIDFAGDAGVHHPLEGAIHRGAANSWMLAVHEADQIIGAEVAFLLQKRTKDVLTFARALAARGTQAGEIGKGAFHEDSVDRVIG